MLLNELLNSLYCSLAAFAISANLLSTSLVTLAISLATANAVIRLLLSPTAVSDTPPNAVPCSSVYR